MELSSNITPSEAHEPGSEIIPAPDCGFPRSAQAFVEAINKNRICQKFIRNKIGQVEAKMEVNKKLRERVKILKDFQVACRKKTGRALSQKKDPRIQLISVPKQRSNAAKDTDMHAINQGPAKNSHVADYRDAMSNYPFALTREPWSKEENENLLKGIKQQFQEMLMQSRFSAEDADCHNLDIMLTEIRHHEISPEDIRSFLPKVNWEYLASMYVTNRSGPECQSRWMNNEDPLINFDSWSETEDKKLLSTVQKRGLCNWIDKADALGTNRTPFQCLSRFQRSLNKSIIRSEWTPPEDEELRNAVAKYGGTNWQLVASALEGRTGPQCSNRWKKSLNPMRKRAGKFAPDEDKRLKIAVKLFGAKNWNKIARFVPGRTKEPCRDRWVNCLNPALNMGQWTPEEDLKLKYAIAEHGRHQWSKVAVCVPPRTDSQCRRRWKVLFPHEVPEVQRAIKMKKATLISNFVDREDERPALTVNDFVAPLLIESAPEPNRDHITSNNQNQGSEPQQCEPKSSFGGNKEHKKTDETLEHVAISNRKTTRPRSIGNRGRRFPTEKIAVDICSLLSPSPSLTEATPQAAGAPPVAAMIGIEYAKLANPSWEVNRKRKVSCRQGDEETIGSFFGRLKKRSCIKTGIREGSSYGEIGDEETIGSFFGKLKKRKHE